LYIDKQRNFYQSPTGQIGFKTRHTYIAVKSQLKEYDGSGVGGEGSGILHGVRKRWSGICGSNYCVQRGGGGRERVRENKNTEVKDGAFRGIRTGDFWITDPALYHWTTRTCVEEKDCQVFEEQ
jgi:hypothetical protein